MKTKHIVILVAAGLIGLAIIYNKLFLPEKPASLDQGGYYKFDQVGYYKSDNKIRYFTFYVNSPEAINKDSIPEELFRAIESHGESRMNTSGKLTGSFYYLSKSQTPNITTFPNAPSANDFAFDRDPIAVVWIYPKGTTALSIRPKDGW